jgi:hypothetical protein
MNTFQHHVLRQADVKIARNGSRLIIEIDSSPMERITISIERGTLSIKENADAAIERKTGVQRVEFEA